MSKTKVRSQLSRFYRGVLKKTTPLLGFTVLQLIILWLVVSGSVAAVVMTRQRPPVIVQETNNSPSTNIPDAKSVTPAPSTNEQEANQPATTPSITPKESAASIAERCLKLHNKELSDDIENFQRDIEFMRKNLANAEVNAHLSTEEENNTLRNKYIKFYNDSRTGSIGVYRQNMVSNGCSAYIRMPDPGYVDYY